MSIDLPGFADPVRDAQAAFRALLDAMSRPGTIQAAGVGLTPPAPLDPATAAALLTLVDAETTLWIAPEMAGAREWIDFHCGPAHAPMHVAQFVLATALLDLGALDAGSDECPERSATVILQVAALGRGSALTLAGPGLAGPARFQAEGLPADFVARWGANHGLYPRGVDLVLCAGASLAALPRSVSVGEG